MESRTPAVLFKAKAACRHHIPKQRHRVTNWAEYDAGQRARGSLTVWFTPEAITAWVAAPCTTRGGQPSYSDLAIATALTLRAVFRLAQRQTEGLIGSILQLLGLDLPVPDHSTLSRRAETLAVPRPQAGRAPVHLLVDSTGLKLCGPGEWLREKHGTKRRRAWRVLHLATDADTGRIVASVLTDKDADDGSQVGPLLDQVDGPVAFVTGDGAYDRDDVYAAVAARHPAATVVVPPRVNAVPSAAAEITPTPRDRHLRCIAERGRMGWQRVSGYNWRALVEADISRWKRVVGDGLRFQTDGRQAIEVAIAADVLNRMLDPGRPEYVRPPCPGTRVGLSAPTPPIRATSVDAPFRARENIRNAVTRSRMLPSVRPLARPSTAGLHGSSRSGSRSRRRTRSTVLQPGCPDPVSPTVAPCPPSARPTPRWPRRAYAATAGARYVPPLTSKAQTMRAILLARAVVTSMRGLRASIRASHEPAAAPR